MIIQLTFRLLRKSSSTQKNPSKSAKILVKRNEKLNSFLGMTSRTCCNLIGCWGMANLFSSNLVQLEAFLSRSRIRVCLVRMVIHGQGQGSEGTQSLKIAISDTRSVWKKSCKIGKMVCKSLASQGRSKNIQILPTWPNLNEPSLQRPL